MNMIEVQQHSVQLFQRPSLLCFSNLSLPFQGMMFMASNDKHSNPETVQRHLDLRAD
jgi:hypothetical protein